MPADNERAAIAAEFADAINQLSVDRLRNLRSYLSTKDHCRYTVADLQEWTQLARQCFNLGNQLTFDVIDILENKLPEIDPDYFLQVATDDALGDQIAARAEVTVARAKAIRALVQKIILSEHAYLAANAQTPEGRFIGAHELGHWLLHPERDKSTFKRYGRYNTKLEDQADRFAREFLMPEHIVRRFKNPSDLAFACNVTRDRATERMSELGLWPIREKRRDERERVNQKFAVLLADLKAGNAQSAKIQNNTIESGKALDFDTMVQAMRFYSGHKKEE